MSESQWKEHTTKAVEALGASKTFCESAYYQIAGALAGFGEAERSELVEPFTNALLVTCEMEKRLGQAAGLIEMLGEKPVDEQYAEMLQIARDSGWSGAQYPGTPSAESIGFDEDEYLRRVDTYAAMELIDDLKLDKLKDKVAYAIGLETEPKSK